MSLSFGNKEITKGVANGRPNATLSAASDGKA
jgi:hypothetical protein